MIPISLTVSPIYDQTGRIIGASKIARDLTALRAYATTLEETVKQSEATARGERVALARERDALRTAQEALHLKDEFLATLSHELRTPLSAISGWLQLVKMRPDQDRVTRGLSAIERNTKSCCCGVSSAWWSMPGVRAFHDLKKYGMRGYIRPTPSPATA